MATSNEKTDRQKAAALGEKLEASRLRLAETERLLNTALRDLEISQADLAVGSSPRVAALETQLADTKAELAEVRNDLTLAKQEAASRAALARRIESAASDAIATLTHSLPA